MDGLGPFWLEEDEYFALTAYVTSTGYQSIVPRGYITERRSDGLYAAPLIPELFYGADGSQLQHSWRQNLTTTGSQVVLSRSGGYPKVPRQELYWRKISDTETRVEEKPISVTVEAPNYGPLILGAIALSIGAILIYALAKK